VYEEADELAQQVLVLLRVVAVAALETHQHGDHLPEEELDVVVGPVLAAELLDAHGELRVVQAAEVRLRDVESPVVVAERHVVHARLLLLLLVESRRFVLQAVLQLKTDIALV